MSDDTDLSDQIETVSEIAADGEQLVSLAVPPGDSVETMRQRLEEDHAEAEYLDAREEVRRPLERSLEEGRRILHEYDETPDNGIAVYVGVVEDDLVEYVFDDPPDPVDDRIYGYANEFDLSPLEPTASETATYGLAVVTRDSATLGRYDGQTIERVETVESDVPSKQAATGRNEDKFQGRSQERAEEFFDAVGDAAARAFVAPPPAETDAEAGGSRTPEVEALLLGGSEVVVDNLADGDHLPDPLADLVEGPLDIEYAAQPGLRQLVDAAEESGSVAETDAREALDRFLDALGDDDEPAVGGRDDVEEALEYEAVETLLLADSLSAQEVQPLEEAAVEQGGSTVVVPTDLDRAERLEEGFDGVAALLRFPVE